MQSRFPALITKRGIAITGALQISSAPNPFLPSILFYIDTGADITQINEVEIAKLGLDIRGLPRSTKPVISCGGRVQAHVINSPIILLLDEDRSHKEFIGLPYLHATEQPLQKGQRGNLLNRLLIPNLLSRDFFIKFGLKLIVDFKTNKAYIEN
jgi:hypothetical protein